jgi:integrase
VVPLSRQALKLLGELHEITGEDRYLFPGDRGARTISENTLNYALWGLGYKGVLARTVFDRAPRPSSTASASAILMDLEANGFQIVKKS